MLRKSQKPSPVAVTSYIHPKVVMTHVANTKINIAQICVRIRHGIKAGVAFYVTSRRRIHEIFAAWQITAVDFSRLEIPIAIATGFKSRSGNPASSIRQINWHIFFLITLSVSYIMRVFCCVLVTLVGLSAVPNVNSQLCLAEDIEKNTEFKYKSRNLYKGLTIFTANFLDAMHKSNPNENLFFSPFSLYHALLLAYFGSANQTEKGLKVRINEFVIQMRATLSLKLDFVEYSETSIIETH